MPKKNRSRNFSKGEEKLLLRLALANKKVIECKATDSVALRLKTEVWSNIEKEFNQQCLLIPRRAVDLREKYNNLKRILRKQGATAKASRFHPGGILALKEKESLTEELKELCETISLPIYETDIVPGDDDYVGETITDSIDPLLTIYPQKMQCNEIIELSEDEKGNDNDNDNGDNDLNTPAENLEEQQSPSLNLNRNQKGWHCYQMKTKSPLQKKYKKSGFSVQPQRNEIVEHDADYSEQRQRHKLKCSAIKEEHKMKMDNLKHERKLAAAESKQRMRHQHAQHAIKMEILKLQLNYAVKNSNVEK